MTVALTMVVRDEAAVIERCIASAKPLISSWTIIDTGSQDDTAAVITRELDGIPGHLHHREWVSHQHNRTELLQLAHDTADYLLLLDADCVLHHDGPLPDLTADLYVARLAGGFQHTLPILVNGRRNGWHYKGAAHAYLTNDQPITAAELETARLEELRSSSPRTDKIERDAQALEAELDPRTIFYLAQSYRDLGYDEPAADLYRLRVRHTAAHNQERFWACYQEGVIRLGLDWSRGVTTLLEAWHIRPTRAEPLWRLAQEYRGKGHPEVALLFAERAAELPLPADNHFVLAWLYEWGTLQERALCRRAVGDHAGAHADFEILAQRDDEAGEFARNQLEERRAA